MNAHDVLLEAAKLVRKGWCQEAAAKTETGRACSEGSKRAVCWCMEGAVIRAAGRPYGGSNPRYKSAWDTVRRHFGGNSLFDLIRWNDAKERTQDEVAKELEAAAQLALKGKP